MSANSHGYGTTHKGKATRDKLHAAVRRLLSEEGWGKFTRVDLARAAYTSPATTYNYVSSLGILTLNAYSEECGALRGACEEAADPIEFINAIILHIGREATPIATALHPTSVEPWQEEDADAPAPPLTFEYLADRLGNLIEREQSESDQPVSRLVANSMARVKLYAVLTAIIADDSQATSMAALM